MHEKQTPVVENKVILCGRYLWAQIMRWFHKIGLRFCLFITIHVYWINYNVKSWNILDYQKYLGGALSILLKFHTGKEKSLNLLAAYMPQLRMWCSFWVVCRLCWATKRKNCRTLKEILMYAKICLRSKKGNVI